MLASSHRVPERQRYSPHACTGFWIALMCFTPSPARSSRLQPFIRKPAPCSLLTVSPSGLVAYSLPSAARCPMRSAPPCFGQTVRVTPRSRPRFPLQRRAPPMLPSSMLRGVHHLLAAIFPLQLYALPSYNASQLPTASRRFPMPPAASRRFPPPPVASCCPARAVQGLKTDILIADRLSSPTISTSLPY
ncbi:hypothetical protein DFH06DRAFT_1472760 [Mycena polygramma]|nr:hypothetical protein DFH06DRAFT_1472760 [Mycena polygramma]